MELIRGLKGLNDRHRGSVVTIGTFDGMHLGHQGRLARVKEHGARLSRPVMVLTFEPMPREFLLAEGQAPARLTSCRERWRILERLGCNFLWLLRFGPLLRNLSGAAFAELLASELRTPLIVVGHDFRFGRNGEATAATLSAAGRRLGRPYSMTGRVVQGNRLGRSLGFPTANLQIERRRPSVHGIFAVRVRGAADTPLPGVASLGTRPTVDGEHTLLEAHVFDFSGDLYGREIEVEFVAKLREEEHFPSLDALVVQMHEDAAQARQILNGLTR